MSETVDARGLACPQPVVLTKRALDPWVIELLACPTCMGYYDLSNKVEAGRISNMYYISMALLDADKPLSF